MTDAFATPSPVEPDQSDSPPASPPMDADQADTHPQAESTTEQLGANEPTAEVAIPVAAAVDAPSDHPNDSPSDSPSDTPSDQSDDGFDLNFGELAIASTDETAADPTTDTPEAEAEGEPPVELQVSLRAEGDHLLLTFPAEAETANGSSSLPLAWIDLWQQFKQRLQGGDRFWQPGTVVHLMARDRLLDARQLQDIAEALTEVQLELKRIHTSRRQTAVAAATAGYSVEQQTLSATEHATRLISNPNRTTPSPKLLAEPLYLHTTLRSGAEVRHPGTVVILGDVNPGSSIVADGDILVWGRLRGVAHAGAAGNPQCLIMALQMEMTQIRIADFVALVPELPPDQHLPEVAYVSGGGIRIARASEFSRSQILASESA